MKKALIVQGGWQGHEPGPVSKILGNALREHDFEVHVSDTLDAFKDESLMKDVDLLVPVWTMGSIQRDQLQPLLEAVRSGTGIAGVHGGMGDAFRTETEYQFMVGGQWVAHPGGDGVHFVVHMDGEPHPITEGIEDFEVSTEHYYMHVDPAVRVLASSRFGSAVMPVTWIKTYGEGRVFYCSLGHHADIVEMPPVLTMVTRGMLWAAHAYPGS
jgi:type 1 glutamine amidotransferase